MLIQPILSFADFDDETVSIEKRKCVVVNARIHPGETNGSWMVQGVLEQLLVPNEKSAELRQLLKT